MKTIFYKDKANEWRWRVKADNGRVVADSGEGYHNKADAEAGFKLVNPQGFIEPADLPEQPLAPGFENDQAQS